MFTKNGKRKEVLKIIFREKKYFKMPFKTDKLKIGNSLDRRVRLLPQQKEEAKKMYQDGISIRGITRHFKVSRRLIQFILFPERKQKNLDDRKKRGGWKQYYRKNEWAKTMKEFRRHKYNLLTEKEKVDIKKIKDEKIKIAEKSSKKNKQSDDNTKAKARKELKDWYVVNHIVNHTSITREEVRKHPQLIEAVRQHLKLKRLVTEKLK